MLLYWTCMVYAEGLYAHRHAGPTANFLLSLFQEAEHIESWILQSRPYIGSIMPSPWLTDNTKGQKQNRTLMYELELVRACISMFEIVSTSSYVIHHVRDRMYELLHYVRASHEFHEKGPQNVKCLPKGDSVTLNSCSTYKLVYMYEFVHTNSFVSYVRACTYELVHQCTILLLPLRVVQRGLLYHWT